MKITIDGDLDPVVIEGKTLVSAFIQSLQTAGAHMDHHLWG